MKYKKGELTSKQLITIIILIISFAVIIAFFVMLGLKSNIDKESCRNSVMLRGTFSILGIKFFSLKCRTQDVCFSMGGDCDESVDEIIKVKTKDELMNKMVNLLVDCWVMMGEGKSDYGEKGDCAICYKVYFDDGIKKGVGTIDWLDFSTYMIQNKISEDGKNYLFYLYGGENIEGYSVITKSKDTYAIVTSIPKEEGLINKFKGFFEKGKQIPPVFTKFSSNKLGRLGCAKFVTEV